MSKLDPLLKTLQVRSSPAEGLVQAYIIHIGDRSESNFRKILELKGIRGKSEQNSLIELFHAHTASHENLPQSSSLLTPLNLSSSSTNVITTGTTTPRFDHHHPTLGSAMALVSAARDGVVERLGTPSLTSVVTGGGGGGGSGVSTPGVGGWGGGTITPGAGGGGGGGGSRSPFIPQQQGEASGSGNTTTSITTTTAGGNLNENLRNIGRFFKRDLSAFGVGVGGRFGGGGGGGNNSSAG